MKGLQISNSGFLCCFVFQAVCISGDTQYVLLTGKSSEGSVNDRWQITAQTKLPHMSELSSSSFYFPISGSLCTLLTFPLIVEQNLKSILIGEKSGSNISMSPLLLFSGGTGTDTRSARLSFCWYSLSSETRSALVFIFAFPDVLQARPRHLCKPPSFVRWNASWVLFSLRNTSRPLHFLWTPYSLCLPSRLAYPPARPCWQ